MLGKEALCIPFPASLLLDDSSKTFLYCFIADEAFQLKINLMGPCPRRMLTSKYVYVITDSLVPKKV
jgi:hypothetical protein